jgi:hypothetical protein
MGKEMKIISWEQGFVHHRIVSAVKRVAFLSDMVSSGPAFGWGERGPGPGR